MVWILQKKKGRKEKMEKKKKFEDILKTTGRVGVGNVLAELDRLGFYAAPTALPRISWRHEYLTSCYPILD